MSCFRPDVLAGRVALVTGGGTGIGFEIARCLGEHGAKVAIASRRREVIDAAARALESEGIACLGLTCDVRESAQVEAVVAGVLERWGRLDVVVNNAAGNFPAPMSGISYNGFKAVVGIDLLGTYNVSKAAYHAWLAAHGGCIVNISAPFDHQGVALQAHVAAAKMGVDALTRTQAVEWGPKGIRANAVAPGPIADTEGMARVSAALGGEARGARPPTPVGRLGTGRDVANAVLWLASDAASFVSGQVFSVCGASSVDGLKTALPD